MSEGDFQRQVISLLGADKDSEIKVRSRWRDISIDMMVDDKRSNIKHIVVIRPKVSVESVALANLFKDIMTRSANEEHLRFSIVARNATSKMGELADELGIELLIVPDEIVLPDGPIKPIQSGVKITSDKSWRVVSGLIALRSSSIRNLSLVQNVSYGWAHATIRHLLVQGIAGKRGNLVSIQDMDRLLNGVAWERPTQELIAKELRIPFEDVFEAARMISGKLSNQNVRHAFSSYFAGSQYTGQSVRFDSVQMYLDPNKIDDIDELIGHGSKEHDMVLQVMAPDRDLFKDARLIGGVTVTSPSQTLLDLAGLGYKGRDLTKAMVSIYGQL